jgi:lipase
MSVSPLFVTTFNDGRGSLLAIHGVGAHGLRFVRLAAALRDWRVIAPDLRGHGRSPSGPPFTVAQHVEDLLPILVGLRAPAVLLGHSFGGLLAWELARAAPDAVAGVILVDPAIGLTPAVSDEGIEAARAERSWPSAEAALADGLAGRSAAAAWAVALDVAVAMTTDSDGRLHEVAATDALITAWSEMRAPFRPSEFRRPTLLIEALPEAGRYVSVDLLNGLRRQLEEQLDHVRVDVPHTIPADTPELLAKLVTDFVDRHQLAAV